MNNASHPPRLSIVVVTLNRRAELLELLTDLDAADLDTGDECIVVDNGSEDGTSEAVRERHPHVRLMRHATNLGAPAARNRAVARAIGDIVVFLDDDARVPDRALFSNVKQAFEKSPDMDLAAFRILDPETGRPRSFEIPSRDKSLAGKPFETSHFIGAGCALKREAYLQAGGMDEFLLYGFEELDLSYRLVALGRRLFYRPDLVSEHRLSSTARPAWRKVYYFYRNKILISARYLPWRMVLVQWAVWGLYALREGFRARRPDAFVAALFSGLAAVPGRLHLRRRDRLSRETLARLRTIEGRLYT